MAVGDDAWKGDVYARYINVGQKGLQVFVTKNGSGVCAPKVKGISPACIRPCFTGSSTEDYVPFFYLNFAKRVW